MRSNKMILLMLVLCLALLLSACDKRQPRPLLTKQDIEEELSQTETEEEPDLTPVITGTNYNLVALSYYSVDVDTCEVIRSTTMIREGADITGSMIVDIIVDSLNDESISLGIDYIEEDDAGYCIISFDGQMEELSAAYPELEDAVLDAVAQSILDNVDSCSGVIYRILGREYVTEGNSFGIDYVYMEN